MQSMLWRCDNCGWGTFDPNAPYKVFGASVRMYEDGRTIEVCQLCVKLMLELAVKWRLRGTVEEPVVPVREGTGL